MSKPPTIHELADALKARKFQIDLPLRRPELWRPGIGNEVRGRLVAQGVRPSIGFEWLDTVMQRRIGSTAYELLGEVLKIHLEIERGQTVQDTSREHPLLVAPGSIVEKKGVPHFTCVRTTVGKRWVFLVSRARLLTLLTPDDKLVWVYGTNM